MARPAVFLDRDGTMIEDVGYLSRVADVRWFPFTVEAIRLLNRAGFLVCVTTNQSGVARGYYGEDAVRALHAHMAAHLSGGEATVDAWLHCPHHPNADVPEYRVECDCRKPLPGMIRQACERFDIDLSRSFVVGDKLADLGSAAGAGARGVLVRTGYGDEIARAHAGGVPDAAYVADDLMAAVSWVLLESGYPHEPS
jgi:D-glycero-D-manno-heptose 1,7-bisphosphate phosphatase